MYNISQECQEFDFYLYVRVKAKELDVEMEVVFTISRDATSNSCPPSSPFGM